MSLPFPSPSPKYHPDSHLLGAVSTGCPIRGPLMVLSSSTPCQLTFFLTLSRQLSHLLGRTNELHQHRDHRRQLLLPISVLL